MEAQERLYRQLRMSPNVNDAGRRPALTCLNRRNWRCCCTPGRTGRPETSRTRSRSASTCPSCPWLEKDRTALSSWNADLTLGLLGCFCFAFKPLSHKLQTLRLQDHVKVGLRAIRERQPGLSSEGQTADSRALSELGFLFTRSALLKVEPSGC